MSTDKTRQQLNEFIHKHIITRELKPTALYFFFRNNFMKFLVSRQQEYKGFFNIL